LRQALRFETELGPELEVLHNIGQGEEIDQMAAGMEWLTIYALGVGGSAIHGVACARTPGARHLQREGAYQFGWWPLYAAWRTGFQTVRRAGASPAIPGRSVNKLLIVA